LMSLIFTRVSTSSEERGACARQDDDFLEEARRCAEILGRVIAGP